MKFGIEVLRGDLDGGSVILTSSGEAWAPSSLMSMNDAWTNPGAVMVMRVLSFVPVNNS
jgi:hypothetical protein